jgi:hypothetical protein
MHPVSSVAFLAQDFVIANRSSVRYLSRRFTMAAAHQADGWGCWRCVPLLAIEDRAPRGRKRELQVHQGPPPNPARRQRVRPVFLQQLIDHGQEAAHRARGGDVVVRVADYVLQCNDAERATVYLHLAELTTTRILVEVIERVNRERAWRFREANYAVRVNLPLAVSPNGVCHGPQL